MSKASEIKTNRAEKLKGFAFIVGKNLEPIKNVDAFKEFSKSINVKLLLNPLDDKYAALITINSGNLKVEGIRNDVPSNLKKSKLGWNGKMSSKLQTFIELATGNISLSRFYKLLVLRKIKVRGLMYFQLLQKLASFLPNSNQPKPKYIDKRKKPLIATKLFLISGILNMTIWILAYGFNLLDIAYSAFLFGILFIWYASMFSKLIKCNLLNEVGILMIIIIMIIFNTLNYLKFIIMRVTEGLFLFNIFLYIVLCFNLINFIIFFETITKLNQMNTREKLNCFSIMLIKGLGWTLLFSYYYYLIMGQFLVVITYVILGIFNIKNSNKLMTKTNDISNDLRRYYKAFITTILTLFCLILIYFIIISDLSSLLNIILFSVVILIQFYYIKKTDFNK